MESGSKNEISGEERKKGNTRSKGERKKGERKKGERRKEERKKGEDEERRRREKSFLPDLRFFFVSIVGFLFVKNEKREKKERKGKPSRKEKGRKENTCVVVSRKRRREKTKGEDVRRYVRVFLRLHCWIQLCSSYVCFFYLGFSTTATGLWYFFSKVVVMGFLVKELRFFFGFRQHSQVSYCLKTNLTSILYR